MKNSIKKPRDKYWTDQKRKLKPVTQRDVPVRMLPESTPGLKHEVLVADEHQQNGDEQVAALELRVRDEARQDRPEGVRAVRLEDLETQRAWGWICGVG